MRRTLLIALIALIAAIMVGTAQAHTFTARTLSDAHVGTAKAELQAQMHYSDRVVKSLTRSAVRWKIAPRHATCWSHVPWAHTCNAARAKLLAHRWLYAVAKQRFDKMYAPKPTYVGVSSSSLYNAFMCIHGGEGAWNADTGNGYYGGLQMDYGFMSTYGSDYLARWGTANNWPPAAQIEVAIRAYNSGRGFGPWPNTARSCGLL